LIEGSQPSRQTSLVLRSLRTAKKRRDARVEIQKLADQGIILRSETRDGVLEEIPEAYKDIDAVVNVVHNAGLARKVARLRPIGVIKG
jgi:tRNA-splicing ligase RtcB